MKNSFEHRVYALHEAYRFTQEIERLFLKEDSAVLSMEYEGENGRWPCYAQAHADQDRYVFYSVIPVTAPEGRRIAVAELLTRANYGMLIGNFELDLDDGEI